MISDEDKFYRYVLIDNQETCYTCVVKVLENYFLNEEDVKEYYKHLYNFKERLFGVRKLDFTETPRWLIERITEQ